MYVFIQKRQRPAFHVVFLIIHAIWHLGSGWKFCPMGLCCILWIAAQNIVCKYFLSCNCNVNMTCFALDKFSSMKFCYRGPRKQFCGCIFIDFIHIGHVSMRVHAGCQRLECLLYCFHMVFVLLLAYVQATRKMYFIRCKLSTSQNETHAKCLFLPFPLPVINFYLSPAVAHVL